MEHYREHNAFKIYEDLSADGSKYEMPYAFVLHHNSIEGLLEDIQYNDFIVSRGYDIDSLHSFAEELYDLA